MDLSDKEVSIALDSMRGRPFKGRKRVKKGRSFVFSLPAPFDACHAGYALKEFERTMDVRDLFLSLLENRLDRPNYNLCGC